MMFKGTCRDRPNSAAVRAWLVGVVLCLPGACGSPAPEAVPEPMTLGLLAVGGWFIAGKHRRPVLSHHLPHCKHIRPYPHPKSCPAQIAVQTPSRPFCEEESA